MTCAGFCDPALMIETKSDGFSSKTAQNSCNPLGPPIVIKMIGSPTSLTLLKRLKNFFFSIRVRHMAHANAFDQNQMSENALTYNYDIL